MKKQVYSSPKTRLVTMSENSFIMQATSKVLEVESNVGIGGKPQPGGGTPRAPRRFLEIN